MLSHKGDLAVALGNSNIWGSKFLSSSEYITRQFGWAFNLFIMTGFRFEKIRFEKNSNHEKEPEAKEEKKKAPKKKAKTTKKKK